MGKYTNDPRVKYIKHERNKNGSAARNTGFIESEGEYICLLDDDDFFLPGRISKQVDFLKTHPEFGACYCWRKRHGKTISSSLTGDLSKPLLDLTFSPTTSALMIRRICYEMLNGFDESYQRHQDYEFLLRFFKLYKIGVVEEVLLEQCGNEVNNQLRGKKLFDTKAKFFSQFKSEIDRLETLNKGYKNKVYAAHFSDACKELIRYGDFGLAFKMYFMYGIKGGFLFWRYFFSRIGAWVKRKIKSEA